MSDAAIDAQLVQDAQRRDKGGKEVHGDFTGYVLDVGGVVKGEFDMDLPNDKVTFHWKDTSSAWPSSFKLRPPGGDTVPTTAVAETFEHKSFTGSAASHDVSGCQYEIQYNGTTYGWMHYSSSGTTWYALPGQLTTGGLINAPELEFVSNTQSSAVNVVKLYDSVI